MGIKDNFSQAVKELWKKDGQSEAPSNNSTGGSMLDQYLKQDNSGGSSVPTGDAGRVPLETPYYPNSDQTASAARQTAEQPNMSEQPNIPEQQAPSQQNQNVQQGFSGGEEYNQGGYNNQNAQYNNQGGQFNRGTAPDAGSAEGAGAPYYRSDAQQGYGANNGGYGDAQGSAPSNYNGNYNANRGVNGGAMPPYGGGNGNSGTMPPYGGGMIAAAPNNGESEEFSLFSKNTIIEGNVHSLANLQVDGNIKGNVETTKNIEMSGKVVGDITCNNAGMNSAAMQGNISLKGRLRMDSDTILIGNLSSQLADINGRIRGNLDVVGKAELKRNAIVFGDINASTIAVTDGAIIQGYVNTTFMSKEDGRKQFPDAISIEDKNNTNNE